MKRGRKVLASLFSVLLALSIGMTCATGASSNQKHWVGSWSAGMTDISITLLEGKENWNGIKISPFAKNMSARIRMTPTLGGNKVRFSLSNENGRKPLMINEVSVARAKGDAGAEIVEGTSIPVTFDGKRQVTIPAGEIVTCDPIDMEVTALEDLCVSYYIENFSEVQTMALHGGTTYLTLGNQVESTKFYGIGLSFGSLISVVPVLCGMDVYADSDAYSIVVIGDSTMSNDIPKKLAQRIIEETGENKVGVLQKSIVGNCLLSDGTGLTGSIYGKAMINRFQKDALEQPGVQYVLLKIGLNDILHPRCKSMEGKIPKPTVEELIAGYQQLIEKAHTADVKIILADMSPWKGYTRDLLHTGNADLEWTQEAQDECNALAEWIRSTDLADGYINLDCLKDPTDPTKMPDGYTEDGAHLLAPAQDAFVGAIDLSLFGIGGGEEDVTDSTGTVSETASDPTESASDTTEPAPDTTETEPASQTEPETENTTEPETAPPSDPETAVTAGEDESSDATAEIPSAVPSTSGSTENSEGTGFVSDPATTAEHNRTVETDPNSGAHNVETGDSLMAAGIALAAISAIGLLVTVKKK